MSTNHPNWVAERAKCHMGLLFEALRNIVIKDVDRRKEEAANPQWRGEFHYAKYGDDPPAFTVENFNQGSYLFTYSLDSDAIFITSQREKLYTISTRWDAEQSRCQIVVASPAGSSREFPHAELWKAVQYVLEPFFFPSEG